MGVVPRSSGSGEADASLGECCLSPRAPRNWIIILEITFNVPDGGATLWFSTVLSNMNLNCLQWVIASLTLWFLSMRSWLKSGKTFEASSIECGYWVSCWSLIPLISSTKLNCIGEVVASSSIWYLMSCSQPSPVPDSKINLIRKCYLRKTFLDFD